MNIEVKFTYSEIKIAYLEVKQYLEYNNEVSIDSLHIRICEDLGYWGDDNVFLLENFIETFHLNFEAFNYEDHFESESGLLNFKGLILGGMKWMVCIISFLVVKPISLSYYHQIRSDLFREEGIKKDLTFGDLVVSKLLGRFCLREDVQISLI